MIYLINDENISNYGQVINFEEIRLIYQHPPLFSKSVKLGSIQLQVPKGLTNTSW